LQGEFIIGANTFIDDMVGSVPPPRDNFQHALDQVIDVRGAGPDIDDSVHVAPRSKIVMDGAKEAILTAAIHPRGANDIAPATSMAYGFFARNLCAAVYIDRLRRVVDRVRCPADGLAVKGILGAKVNHLRVQPTGRRSERSRAFNVDGSSFGRI